MRVLLVESGLSAARRFFFFLEKRHQNTRRNRATAPADLEPPKGLEFGLGLGLGTGLGLGWSWSTCKVEIDDTRPAQRFVRGAAAHSGSRSVLRTKAYSHTIDVNNYCIPTWYTETSRDARPNCCCRRRGRRYTLRLSICLGNVRTVCVVILEK